VDVLNVPLVESLNATQFEFDYTEQMRRSRGGVALLPTFIAAASLRDGTLQRVLVDYKAPPLALYALYPPTRHLAVRVRLFIDFLVGRFGRNPWWDEKV
jgi:DNA-binding transcriptional LysR family regulator